MVVTKSGTCHGAHLAAHACIWPTPYKLSPIAHLQGHYIGAVAHEQAQQRWQGLLQQLGQIPSRSMTLHTNAYAVACREVARCEAVE